MQTVCQKNVNLGLSFVTITNYACHEYNAQQFHFPGDKSPE
jgi:hypothetical protein